MTDTNSTTSGGGGADGFFSTIKSGFAEGISRIGSELLPIWAEKTLQGQRADKLSDPTFDATKSAGRIDDGTLGTGAGAPASISAGGVTLTGPGLNLTVAASVLLLVIAGMFVLFRR